MIIGKEPMVRTLLLLGAHIGHVYTDTSDNMSDYVLGSRNFFLVVDVRKTIVSSKKAVSFYEQLIRRYGHTVFCYSGVANTSIQLRIFLSTLLTERGQSFSYRKWAAGSVTNYRLVFLRLVTLPYKDISVRVYREKLDCVRASYDISANRGIRKAWLVFKKLNMLSPDDAIEQQEKFRSLFYRYKMVMLRKYLSNVDSAKRRSRLRHSALDVAKQARHNSFAKNLLRGPRRRHIDLVDMRWAGDGQSRQRVLPTFISLLLRLFFVIQTSGADLLASGEKRHGTLEEYYNALYRRMLVFWRAIIFFRYFKKTANLPDCLVMLNPDNKTAELFDFIGVRLPIICVADTNTDLSLITYPIPSNDDSLVLLIFYFLIFANACGHACVDRYIEIDNPVDDVGTYAAAV